MPPVAPKGFLVTGMSGSGKSTLIDAISSVLVPPGRVDFTAAAPQNAKRGQNQRTAKNRAYIFPLCLQSTFKQYDDQSNYTDKLGNFSIGEIDEAGNITAKDHSDDHEENEGRNSSAC